MQFFIIHPDPIENAKLLPDYAIKKVNCREGIQILSDIGHNLGITWEGQNKAYSPWHAETRRFMVDRSALTYFMNHMLTCLRKYDELIGKENPYWKKFVNVPWVDLLRQLPIIRTHEEFMLDYMIRGKADKMSSEDLERLKEYQNKCVNFAVNRKN